MGLGRTLISTAITGSLLLSALTPQASAGVRFNPSIGYHYNTRWPNGVVADYNPVSLRLNVEFDTDLWGFNKFTLTPFFGTLGDDYERGIAAGLKKVATNGNVRPYGLMEAGVIHESRDIEEHVKGGEPRRQENHTHYHLLFGGGLEIGLTESLGLTLLLGYRHMSDGDKIKNNIEDGNFQGSNEGNPGVNGVLAQVGVIYPF